MLIFIGRDMFNYGFKDDAIYLPDRDARIAELAYLKAENRGFEPGHELDDWLEAEQEFLL